MSRGKKKETERKHIWRRTRKSTSTREANTKDKGGRRRVRRMNIDKGKQVTEKKNGERRKATGKKRRKRQRKMQRQAIQKRQLASGAEKHSETYSTTTTYKK